MDYYSAAGEMALFANFSTSCFDVILSGICSGRPRQLLIFLASISILVSAFRPAVCLYPVPVPFSVSCPTGISNYLNPKPVFFIWS